ncbi:MAG: DNA topoisomerase VI subunit B [Planctomycetes bacterium]|nr:DNA topoisomerase VI subunit B [Planctomycetota bacterium]
MASNPSDAEAPLLAAQLSLPFPKVKAAVKKESPRAAPPTAGEPVKPAPAPRRGLSAESLAKQQREISVSEFFAKNRHLLGFDSKRKALLTTVKEAVDNSLDACEEAAILPDIEVAVRQTDQDRFAVTVRDNGPGIVKQQIPNIFGKLLYGSKFHRLKMARGQQGIGISAAGMYGLITTGKPVRIISRTGSRALAHRYALAIDTKKNRPDIINDDTVDVDWPHGTEVTIELQGTYNRGRQSIDEYLELTAVANPHARIVYHPPAGPVVEFPRGTETLPEETKEIKPHPYGIELGTLMKMLKETRAKKLGAFLTTEFSRVSNAIAKRVCTEAGVTTATWVTGVTPPVAERLYSVLQNTRLKAPSTNCLAPIGAEAILAGLLKGVKAEFYTASTRPPSVYRGNPFQVEVGLAYGGELGADHRDHGEGSGKDNGAAFARVIRFANRVPLLYQQSSCATFKAVAETRWNNYGLSQSTGSLPRAPMVILIHMASVWVPFISEGKEAIADYDEIRKEAKLALAECGRRLATLLRRKRTKATYSKRRDVFTRYIDEVVDSVRAITVVDKDDFRRSLVSLSRNYTVQADLEFDEHGKVVKRATSDNDLGLADTIVVDRNGDMPAPSSLFDAEEVPLSGKRQKSVRAKPRPAKGRRTTKKRRS